MPIHDPMGEEHMRNFMTKIWNDKRGNAMIIAAAALPLLIGSAGLATDTIQWALWKRQLQRAADSAAIAGVYDRIAAKATTGTAAAVDKDLGLNNQTGMALQATYPKVTFPADAGTQRNQVKVELAVQRKLSFSAMFMTNPPLITASSTAAAISSDGEFCVLSLQNNSKTGIQATGNATIVMDCGMMTNSVSTNSAAGQGSSSVTATTLAAAGGIQQSSNWTVDSYQPYSPALEDPYATLAPDSDDFASCATSPPSLSINNTNSGLEVDGGACYSSLSIGSNRTLTLKNGTYVISGGSVNIQGTLNLTNATLLLTNKNGGATQPIGSMDMNASGALNATAPTTGKWKGMAIYQDRRAVDDSPTGNISASSPNKINGNSTNKITGVVYFPNQQLTYNGNGTGSATCTQFVAKRIYWSGSSGINNFTAGADCKLKGISAIKTSLRVRLVA
ncbi:MAG: Tad domain-containing protein [Sphingomonas bacterium]|nr:Tad domain-containing protein [Sphingomonas bacterium]